MVTTRWLVATRIFEEAIQLPPESRAAFVRGECEGDEEVRARLRRAMWAHVGLVRSEASLRRMLDILEKLAATPGLGGEVSNMLTVSHAITVAALARQESRGGHYREDFPTTDPSLAQRSRMTASQWPTTRVPGKRVGSRE